MLLLSVAGLTSAVGTIGAASQAFAGHGGVVQVNRAVAGPYILSVWTQPTPPRTGPWRVDIAVMRAGSVPVGNVAVRVRAEPLDGGAGPIETDANRDADPLGMRYRASLRLGAAGPWAVSVSVTGPEGTGSLRFPVDVEPSNWDWWVLGALGLVGVAAAPPLIEPGSIVDAANALARLLF